ncbi:hypothetical protein [Odoribacter lunatus]|uniref:hypothetical protein n=1 Tax=Odoribacter lunatus TaxID=2941335 RepID=UPI00203A93C5|nr:hypothetical protein [Odoribacter lunatus]
MYEIIAFYRETEREVQIQAERFAGLYGFHVRYEKYPSVASQVSVLVGEDTVVCLFERGRLNFHKLLKYVYSVKRPALIYSGEEMGEVYNCLRLPVGYLTENKEKAAWANFFLHNNRQARVEVWVPRERDERIAGMVEDNLIFIEKVFTDSGVVYKTEMAGVSFEKLVKSLFQTSEKAMIFLMLPFRVFSFFVPYYLRLYKRYARTPILLIPRDETLYIPCH